ncbi:MAG: MBL fold metallo-hydrolase [Acidimicrobiia bacterium]|nr:MBL fold metallo-hydrolase [Acidimicrobiia bacterium]
MFEPMLLEVRNASAFTGSGNNTYLLAPAGGPACLIDAGIGTEEHIEVIATHTAARHSPLTDVLVTHAHVDHASGAPALARRLRVARFGKHVWPEYDPAGVNWHHVADGARLAVGGTELTALHTPGHAPDHLAFWHEASSTVFTGDLVHAGTSVAIIHSRGGDLIQYVASLERILALEPQRLLPGHGPAIDEPARVLSVTLAHRRRREAQVIEALRRGASTVQMITDSIYDGLAPGLVVLARENVRAHLEKLRHEGRATCDADEWRGT